MKSTCYEGYPPLPPMSINQRLTGRYHRIRGVAAHSRYWHTASHAASCDYGNPDLLRIWVK
jgi:hypothetical protein